MILFKKVPATQAPLEPPIQASRAEPDANIEKQSARRKKADSDGTLRRMRQTAEDDKLL